jgi:hypothetical protein
MKLTLKQFIFGKRITAIDTVDGFDLIINVYVDDACHGLNVDLSNVPGGTSITTREDFTIEGDILSVGAITIDMSKTEMLG